jgi:hypothetical protein
LVASRFRRDPRLTTKYDIQRIDNILPDIVAAKPACGLYRQLVLHMNNFSPHQVVSTAQKLLENGIVAIPQPALSPDLAPSDFFLFGALKGQLADRAFESANELAEEICEMATAIRQARLETIFLELEKGLQPCIFINGADVDSTTTQFNRYMAVNK